jgi:hypothetical protein
MKRQFIYPKEENKALRGNEELFYCPKKEKAGLIGK